jgi:hypothetical protein
MTHCIYSSSTNQSMEGKITGLLYTACLGSLLFTKITQFVQTIDFNLCKRF